MHALSPTRPATHRAELRALLSLSAPLVVANLGNVLLGAVDTAVVGRLGAVELGAVGLGNAIFFALVVVGLGTMLGLDPLLAQAFGAGEHKQARTYLWQGVWLSGVVAVPLAAIVLAALLLLEHIGIDAATAKYTAEYVVARLPSLLPWLAFNAARSYLQAAGRTRPMVVGVVLANVINLPASWFLVLGDDGLTRLGLAAIGMPALGAAGAGWATTIAVVAQLAVVAAAVRGIPAAVDTEPLRRIQWPLLGRIVKVGLPVGLQLAAEVGVFSLSTVLAGLLGTTPLAAHHVALTLATTTFMVPLAVGSAAAVLVGWSVGRGDAEATRRAGQVALGTAVAFGALAALLFVSARHALATLLSEQDAVVSAAAPLLLVAAVFQLADAVQVVASGLLRGAGDTRLPLVVNLLAHYGGSLPLGALLCFGLGAGVAGLWWGLCLGLTLVAIALAVRFLRRSRTAYQRV